MIKYYKLFDLLNRKNMKKTDLLEIISSPTLAKLSKGEIIKTDIIDKICQYLECQPGDIMESVTTSTDELQISENEITELYNRYDIYHEKISKNEFEKCLKKCLKSKNNEIIINQDKLTKYIKDLYYKKTKNGIIY